MVPWTATITLPNTVSGNDGQFDAKHSEGSRWYYTYQKKNGYKTEMILERLPMRCIELRNPAQYHGTVGNKTTDPD